jgi:hypothetical protein
MPVNCIYPQNGPFKQCHWIFNIFANFLLPLIAHELAEYFYLGFRWIGVELTQIPGILWKHPKTADFWSTPSVLQLAVSRTKHKSLRAQYYSGESDHFSLIDHSLSKWLCGSSILNCFHTDFCWLLLCFLPTAARLMFNCRPGFSWCQLCLV